MLTGIYQKRVRYAETDKMGYLYYGHYAQYYEIGRAELIRELGLSYHDLEEVYGVMMPVMRLECKFRLPAYYDELLEIRTTLPFMPTRYIQFDQEIYNPKGTLINTGTVKLFFVNIASGQRISCPEVLHKKLYPHFEIH